ncbi:hypothetical protein ES332_A09G087200v1, partial [Gossypium tomentosum]
NQSAFCSLPSSFYFLCLADSRASSASHVPPRIVAHGSGTTRTKGVPWPDMHAGERGSDGRNRRCCQKRPVAALQEGQRLGFAF